MVSLLIECPTQSIELGGWQIQVLGRLPWIFQELDPLPQVLVQLGVASLHGFPGLQFLELSTLDQLSSKPLQI